MSCKDIEWMGSSFDDLCDPGVFSLEARKNAGHQLNNVQNGLEPDHWKPFQEVGSGTNEIIIDVKDGWYRVLYVAKFPDAVYVLHCFKKKTNTTAAGDKEVAKARYKEILKKRSAK